MSESYTKLFNSIIHSTIWREPDHVRLVWITMLAMADRHGSVQSSIPGLADAARVTLDQAVEALDTLKSPDKYSRTTEHEGRRIADTDGGWVLLNHAKYREKLSKADKDRQNADRQKRYRERKKAEAGALRTCRREITQAEAEADPEAKADHLESVTRERATQELELHGKVKPPQDFQPSDRQVRQLVKVGANPQHMPALVHKFKQVPFKQSVQTWPERFGTFVVDNIQRYGKPRDLPTPKPGKPSNEPKPTKPSRGFR